MSLCPGCKSDAQVVRLAEFWRSLPQDAELKRSLAQPPTYVAQWLLLAGLLGGGGVLLWAGSAGLGGVLLAVGVAAGGWMWHRYGSVEEERERWARMLYCRRCPAQFLPGTV